MRSRTARARTNARPVTFTDVPGDAFEEEFTAPVEEHDPSAFDGDGDGNQNPDPISDGNPPASSPTPTLTPANRSLEVSWTAVRNADLVTYEIHASTSSGFTPDATTLKGRVTGTGWTIPGLVNGTTYYVKLVATDVDGAAAASAQASAAPRDGNGSPPGSSPTPAVVGAHRMLYAYWSPVIQDDPVTYEVYCSTTNNFTPSGANKVGEINGLFFEIKEAPLGTPLAYGTTYYVKIIAKDKDGSAAASAQGSSQLVQITGPDIAANTITANMIVAGQIVASHFAGSTFVGYEFTGSIFTGGTIRTSAGGNRVEMLDSAVDRIKFWMSGSLIGEIIGYTNAIEISGRAGSSRIVRIDCGQTYSFDNTGATFTGTFTLNAQFNARNIIPQTGDTYLLGGAANRWGNGYINQIETEQVAPRNTTSTIGTGTGSSARFANGYFGTVHRVSEVTISDERLKKQITDSPLGIKFIRKLKPRRYELPQPEPDPDDETVIAYTPIMVDGFIAQEVERAGGRVITYPDGTLGISYSELIAPIVGAIQDLDKRLGLLEAI